MERCYDCAKPHGEKHDAGCELAVGDYGHDYTQEDERQDA